MTVPSSVPTRGGFKLGFVALLAVTVLAACTPDDTSNAPTTSIADTTTTSEPSTTETIPRPVDPSAPPEVPDPADVATDSIIVPPGYEIADTGDVFTQDATFAIGSWLPNSIVAGTADEVLVDDRGDTILVVSVTPTMEWRGAPELVPALADLDTTGEEVSTGVLRTETASGLVLHLWSSGDGFIVATSLVEEAAQAYLAALEDGRAPVDVWEPGSCLYIDPDEGLPWAPFPPDAVVRCDGPHNAEVLDAQQVADGFDRYDPDVIAYQRSYLCDRSYEAAIGPQRDHRPTLVTYMPDADEYERGDRYLACVIRLETADGPRLVSGRIADRTDLAWDPVIGDCYPVDFSPNEIDCSGAHGFEYVGDVEYSGASWPDDPSTAFAEACQPVLSSLADGPAPLDAFPVGLYPYAFENGERSIRCMAFAVTDSGPGSVLGSFADEWRVIEPGGIPA